MIPEMTEPAPAIDTTGMPKNVRFVTEARYISGRRYGNTSADRPTSIIPISANRVAYTNTCRNDDECVPQYRNASDATTDTTSETIGARWRVRCVTPSGSTPSNDHANSDRVLDTSEM